MSCVLSKDKTSSHWHAYSSMISYAARGSRLAKQPLRWTDPKSTATKYGWEALVAGSSCSDPHHACFLAFLILTSAGTSVVTQRPAHTSGHTTDVRIKNEPRHGTQTLTARGTDTTHFRDLAHDTNGECHFRRATAVELDKAPRWQRTRRLAGRFNPVRVGVPQ